MKLVERRIFIDASPTRVYELLTDPELLAGWLAPLVRADPRPGGELTWTHHNGDTVAGTYVELVPDRRVKFTYGWTRPEVGIAPGSTVVTIDLRPSRGGTDLHLVHRGLSDPMADAHDGGWANYLARLAAVAEGGDPGPDPLADQRVPDADPETYFWASASPLLEGAGVTRSTMMGFVCLRLDGEFFASFDHRNGALVVKLDEASVDGRLASGRAQPFAPNGRRFKEWAAVPAGGIDLWEDILHDALARAIDRRDRSRRNARPR